MTASNMKWSIWSGITKLLGDFDDIARVAVLDVAVMWLQMRKNKTKGNCMIWNDCDSQQR